MQSKRVMVTIFKGVGREGVGPHIRAALFFRHRHAHGDRLFFRHGPVTGVVAQVQDARQSLCGQLRLRPQGQHHGAGHGDRAAMPRLDLALQIKMGGAGHMGPSLWPQPGGRVQAVRHRHLHQLVVGRVKTHLVDAVP